MGNCTEGSNPSSSTTEELLYVLSNIFLKSKILLPCKLFFKFKKSYIKIKLCYNQTNEIRLFFNAVKDYRKGRVKMKKAFTMLELIFVIVVIGVLLAIIVPSTRTNPVQEATVDLASQIRYTQHLAMIDDKYNAADNTWFINRWQIVFSGVNNRFYTIQSDNGTTFAKDPQDRTNINNVELKGNVSLAFGGGCNGQTIISFDHLGRPMIGSLAATTSPYTAAGTAGELLSADCTITVSSGAESAILTITPETGYVSVVYN